MKRNNLNTFAVIFFGVCVAVTVGSDTVFAYDDFGRIVRHIEVNYHVHRSHRFLMACVGVVVKFWHGSGVKSFKAAIFEDQHLAATDSDTGLDDIVQRAGKSGWQPVVKSYSRRSGEHSYVYGRSEGKDLELLIVSVETNEADVVQVRIDPDRLTQFIDEHSGGASRHREHAHGRDAGLMAFQ